MKDHGVLSCEDLPAFWNRRPKLARRILPYLWWPLTSAAIERSFSLAGAVTGHAQQLSLTFTALVDVKNRNKGCEEYKAATVGMFCNGDVEGRFSQGMNLYFCV